MSGFFYGLLALVIAQRLVELQLAAGNTRLLRKKGGIEFGASHYPAIVLLHSAFFVSLIAEFILTGGNSLAVWPIFFILFLAAQLGRWWVLRTLGSRWTTRVIVIPGAPMINTGPFRLLRHPNYTIVMIEIATLPLIFGLYLTAIIFTISNAALLLTLRIPVERQALDWAQGRPAAGVR